MGNDSDSEDPMQASLEPPSESGSGSWSKSVGTRKRGNPLAMGGRGLAGMGMGLIKEKDKPKPGGGANGNGGSPAKGLPFSGAAKTGALSSLSALRPKAKAKSSGYSALGGQIDWNQANDRW